MVIDLHDLDNEKSVAEFKVVVNEDEFVISPKIYNDGFYHLIEDLLFIRVKWMTIYLNHEDLSKELETGVIQDIIEMLEHEIIYQNMLGGTYKIIYHVI